MVKSAEAILQEHVANYLSLHYPDVPFHSDYGSGIKLTIGQAARQKRQNGGRRAWPDMVIAAPSFDWDNDVYNEDGKWAAMPYFGLFLELKKEGTNLYAKRKLDDPKKKSLDGKIYADEHICEQADVLYRLREEGYMAVFAVGFDEATKTIDQYLGGKE